MRSKNVIVKDHDSNQELLELDNEASPSVAGNQMKQLDLFAKPNRQIKKERRKKIFQIRCFRRIMAPRGRYPLREKTRNFL